MSRASTSHFSLRFLLGATTVLAVLFGLREFIWAAIAVLVCLLYAMLMISGRLTLHFFPLASSPYLRTTEFDPSATFRILCVAGVLIPYRIWHSVVHLGWDADLAYYFSEPLVFGMTIYTFQQAVIIATELFLLSVFFGNCMGTGKLSSVECRNTTGLLTVLLLSHLAHPWFMPVFLDIYRWMNPQWFVPPVE